MPVVCMPTGILMLVKRPKCYFLCLNVPVINSVSVMAARRESLDRV